jgi:hypothetical protein
MKTIAAFLCLISAAMAFVPQQVTKGMLKSSLIPEDIEIQMYGLSRQ